MSLCNDVVIDQYLKGQLADLADPQNAVLLDLGCGRQPHRSLYDSLFKTIVTADFAVRSKIGVQIDVSALPFRDSSFDVILLTEVIEHLQDTALALTEISRVLRRGGHLLITWPFIYPLHELPGDYNRYTEYGMERLLKHAGLRVENIQRRGDVLCVLLAIGEQFVFNGLEVLARTPVLGRNVFGSAKRMMSVLARISWETYFLLLRGSKRTRPDKIGEALKGPLNHLALWTLGYCARATKSSNT